MASVDSSNVMIGSQSNNNESEQQANTVGDVTKIKEEHIIDQQSTTNSDSSKMMNISRNNNNSNNNNNNNNNNVNSNADDDEDDQEYDDDECHDDNGDQNGIKNESMDDNEKTNLIVNYLPQQMTDAEFEELFKKFGKMKSCKIVRNRMTGYSYGFGFVDFDTHEQALQAIDELNGHEVAKKKIKVAFARPAGQDIKQANLYVKNVPDTWSQDDVKKVFEPYGQIIQVRVLGDNRGVAFVLFDLRKQAEDAMEALNGQKIEGCETPFEIKFAADKKSGNKQSGGGRSGPGRRGGGDRGGARNQSNNRNNRSDSNQRRGTSQGRGSGDRGGGRMFNKGNANNNNNYDNTNGGIGPIRQQQGNRMNRYAPFAPMQQPPMAPQPPIAQMNPYGYAQQPMMPYMMPSQPTMMQMNPMAQQSMQMGGPVGPYSMGAGAQMGPIGYAQPPMAQPSAAMSNMYNVASNTMNNAAQMQPQLGQPMNMRGGGATSGHSGGGGNRGDNSDGVTLFVYNIGPNSDENELRTIFGPYGDVLRCNVVRKTPGGETKGFGFVTVRNRDQADAAISGLNGQMRNGKPLQVSFKK